MITITPELRAAIHRYWAATTPDEERAAYAEARRLGLPPCYGETPDPTIDEPWQFGGDGGFLA